MKKILFLLVVSFGFISGNSQQMNREAICNKLVNSPAFNNKAVKNQSRVFMTQFSSLKLNHLIGFNGQNLTRLYRPTWTTNYLVNELNVSNGERNIQGFGRANYKIPFYMYSRKYDAFYDALERQNH